MTNILTLGEIMLRFSTAGEARLSQVDNLNVHYGGSEANVAVSLANFGHQVSFASIIPNNAFGLAARRHLQGFQIDTGHIKSANGRMGTYYLEVGVGQRASAVLYDRENSSFANTSTLCWDFDSLFNGIELFHLSGITPALSQSWKRNTLTLVREAKKRHITISFDMNYRAKLWSQTEAGQFLKEILPLVDYCSLGKLDAIHLLGIAEMGNQLQVYYKKISEQFPNVKVIYGTKRDIFSTEHHTIQGFIFRHDTLTEAKVYTLNPIVDRVGGGDAFTAGVLHGLTLNKDDAFTIEFATAGAALKHSVHGDHNDFTASEVEQFMVNDSSKIIR